MKCDTGGSPRQPDCARCCAGGNRPTYRRTRNSDRAAGGSRDIDGPYSGAGCRDRPRRTTRQRNRSGYTSGNSDRLSASASDNTDRCRCTRKPDTCRRDRTEVAKTADPMIAVTGPVRPMLPVLLQTIAEPPVTGPAIVTVTADIPSMVEKPADDPVMPLVAVDVPPAIGSAVAEPAISSVPVESTETTTAPPAAPSIPMVP